MRDVTPPPLQGPSAKEKKYDRQLRLWAASGQAALEEAHVLLLNFGCGVLGVETLKNLVLPGIGSFTIADEERVREADLGVNFFLEDDAIGKSRAQHCCELLKELNPDVRGHYISEVGGPIEPAGTVLPLSLTVRKSIESTLARPDFLTSFSLIIVTAPAPRGTLQTVAKAAKQHHVPLFYVQSLGFYSHISLSLPEAFPIVETHPDPVSAVELRLLDPWPELLSLAKEETTKLDSLSDYEHGHVPYLLLLLHYLSLWRDEHGDLPPRNYQEKSEFRKLVQQGARTNNAEGGEENYDEAVAAVLKALNPPSLSSGVREVFEASECKGLVKKSANFWIIASAVAAFHDKHSALPLPGSLPDMKAQSAEYIRLQNVYRSKARQDLIEVLSTVREAEERLGRATAIPEKEVEAFCRGAGTVRLIRGRPLQIATYLEGDGWGDRAQSAYQALQFPDSLLPLHVAFLATASDADDLIATSTETSTVEGAPPDNIERKEKVMLDRATHILRDLWRGNDKDFDAELEAAQKDEDDEDNNVAKRVKTAVSRMIKELLRADGSEMHNISALTGGMVAQEAIKVVTKQYIPIDNTCVFDGITSRTAVYRL